MHEATLNAKKEETEAKKEEPEVKTEEAEVKTEKAEVKTEEAEVKADEAEVKKEETEVKQEETEVKKEEPDVKNEDTKIKKEEVEVKTEEVEVTKSEDIEVKEEPVEDVTPPVATLTETEQGIWFAKKPVPDLTPWMLAASFAKFTLPSKDEGFEDIRFGWADAAGSETYLRAWIQKQKIECRMEDLQPSEWFTQRLSALQQVLKQWRDRQAEYQYLTHMQKQTQQGQWGETAETKTDEDTEEMKEKQIEQTLEDLDVSSVEDVCRTSAGGAPLFAEFEPEDWALLALRAELVLLTQAFRRDAGDPERVGIHEQHLAFYYNKYFRKVFNVKLYSVSTNKELIDMVDDSVTIDDKTSVLQSKLPAGLEKFDALVKLTEESRRERRQRIEAGDDQARLKFPPMESLSPPVPHARHPRSGYPVGAPPPHQYGKDPYGKGGKFPGYHPKGYGCGKGGPHMGAGRYMEPPPPARMYASGVMGAPAAMSARRPYGEGYGVFYGR